MSILTQKCTGKKNFNLFDLVALCHVQKWRHFLKVLFDKLSWLLGSAVPSDGATEPPSSKDESLKKISEQTLITPDIQSVRLYMKGSFVAPGIDSH